MPLGVPPDLVGTQAGVCHALAHLFADELFWFEPLGWHAWSGSVWEEGGEGAARELVRRAGESMFQIAAEALQGFVGEPPEENEAPGEAERRRAAEGKAKRWRRWGEQCQESGYQESVLRQYAHMPLVRVPIELSLRNPAWVNLRNGILDLGSGTFHRHPRIRGTDALRTGEMADTRMLYPRLVAGTPYPDVANLQWVADQETEWWRSQCPVFIRFMQQTTMDRPALMENIRQALAYSLTGYTHERQLFICHGSGANGKSLLMGVMAKIFGKYACTTPGSMLSKTANDRETMILLSRMVGKRLMLSTEYESGDILPEGIIKAMTGGTDEVVARGMYQSPFSYVPEFKVWMLTNHKPTLQTSSASMRSRVRMIPFDNVVPAEIQDIHLHDRIMAEAPYVLLWVLSGWLRLQQNHNQRIEWCSDVLDSTDEYFEDQDIMAQFFAEKAYIERGSRVWSIYLYKAYSDWCLARGFKAWAHRAFIIKLKESNPAIKTAKSSGRMSVLNVRLFGRIGDNRYRHHPEGDFIDDQDPPY